MKSGLFMDKLLNLKKNPGDQIFFLKRMNCYVAQIPDSFMLQKTGV